MGPSNAGLSAGLWLVVPLVATHHTINSVGVAGTTAAAAAAAATTTAAEVSRMMNNSNFESHNSPGGGCDPVVTSKYTTPTECQAACDATPTCDMWTYVPAHLRPSPPTPWCCLKQCAVADGVRQCPDPNTEAGLFSGAKFPANYSNTCVGPTCFDFAVDWSSGGPATTLPTFNFSVRKIEAIFYPPDGKIYAYVDIVNFTDVYYPDSYSSEVGVYSSADGRTGWVYHGIVIPRGASGGWDGGGIASPGAAVADDGTVLVGYAAENAPSGGINRGIGVATAPHPLGPFTKSPVEVASPTGVCGGSGRCDDVIMQSRPGGEIHLYHSVKGGAPPPGDGIRHRMTTDHGKTWSDSELVLSSTLQPGTNPAETIAGKYVPGALGGKGAMVLILDGGPGDALHVYLSKTSGDMVTFVAAAQPTLTTHPPANGMKMNSWANSQIGFIPGASDQIVGVAYSMYTGVPVYSQEKKSMNMGYTHTVWNFTVPPH